MLFRFTMCYVLFCNKPEDALLLFQSAKRYKQIRNTNEAKGHTYLAS